MRYYAKVVGLDFTWENRSNTTDKFVHVPNLLPNNQYHSIFSINVHLWIWLFPIYWIIISEANEVGMGNTSDSYEFMTKGDVPNAPAIPTAKLINASLVGIIYGL